LGFSKLKLDIFFELEKSEEFWDQKHLMPFLKKKKKFKEKKKSKKNSEKKVWEKFQFSQP